MAKISISHQFPRPPPIYPSQRQPQADEDNFSVLDESILDSDTTAMSPGMQNRRESFAESNAVFSPSNAAWPGYSYGPEHMNLQPSSASTHPLAEHGNHSFPRSQASDNIPYSNQTSTWHLNGTSGSCTPTAGYEALDSDYTNNIISSYNNTVARPSPTNVFEGLQLRSTTVFQPNAVSTTSPLSGKDWMSNSSPEHQGDWPTSTQPRSNSPFNHGNLHLFRREGIRKKNARFEIPAERNLRTIDHLINQTNDEQEIKELKQQKRLLRNRQAALDSRQRKKQHTERLEEEKKHFTTIITDLEDALGEMKIRETEWIREKENWTATQQQYKQYVDTLIKEKEDLVRCHTIESGELRKKNSFLVGQIHRMESTTMSTAPSSTGFSTDFSDFDHLTMHSSPWENFSAVNEFSIENEPQVDCPVPSSSQVKPPAKEDDRAATSGFLLLLLLCGAWVTSKSSTSAMRLPLMPEDVRAASAAVLDHIYQDAGIQPDYISQPSSYDTQATKTTSASEPRKTTLSAFEIASLSKSPLQSLHHHLTTPTEEQMRDQLFSLTPSQYNAISSDTNYEHQRMYQPSHRPNLEETLGTFRSSGEGGAAEIYTRSLMWDKVPHEVVKDFARMVSECDAAAQWKSEPVG